MGFDYERLPVLCRALDRHPMPIAQFDYDEVTYRSNNRRYDRTINELNGMGLSFKPHFGWREHVELVSERVSEKSTRRWVV